MLLVNEKLFSQDRFDKECESNSGLAQKHPRRHNQPNFRTNQKCKEGRRMNGDYERTFANR